MFESKREARVGCCPRCRTAEIRDPRGRHLTATPSPQVLFVGERCSELWLVGLCASSLSLEAKEVTSAAGPVTPTPVPPAGTT